MERLWPDANCAHPTHFAHLFEREAAWIQRVRGLPANASTRSHQRLDEATELDAGDAVQLAREHADLLQRCPAMAVLGGCYGTDERHVDEMSRACAHHRPVPRHN
jgi:homocysteine S-methyltransferase